MKTLDDSRRLAESLVAIGNASGVRTEALITRMDAPLGREVGNASESGREPRDAEGQGPGRARSSCRSCWRRACWCWPGIAADQAAAERAVRRALVIGRRRRGVPPHHRTSGRRPEGGRRLLPAAVGARRAPRRRAARAASSSRSHAENWSAGRRWRSAPAGRRSTTSSIRASGSPSWRRPAPRWRAGDAVLIVRHRGGRGLDDAAAAARGSAVRIGDDRAGAEQPLIVDAIGVQSDNSAHHARIAPDG